MDGISQKVEHTIRENRLLERGDSVLVALSGGPDSVALLHIMIELAPAFDLKIAAVHLDHAIRSKSKQDREFCAKLCRSLKVKMYARRVDVKALAKRKKLSLEEAGREARYAYFESLSDKYGFAKIATGHTLDDSVETVLLNIARGAGLAGLSGIPMCRGNIIRPLLGVEKRELIAWLKERKIAFRIDPTNVLPAFARNRIRSKVIPELEKINPGVRRNIARLSAIAAEELEYAAVSRVSAYEKALISVDKAKIVLDLGKLELYDRSLRKKVMEEAFKRLCPTSENMPFDAYSRGLGIVNGHSGAKTHLAQGVFLEKSQGRVALFVDSLKPNSVELVIPGKTRLPDGGNCLESEILEKGDFDGFGPSEDVGHLDYGKMNSVSVRFWRKSDRIRPLGMKGTRLLSDVFIDRRVPEYERERVPLVVSDGKIAWIAGVMVSDEFKITSRTKRILRLKLCAP